MPARKYQDQYQQKGDDKNNFNFCKQNRINDENKQEKTHNSKDG